MAGVVYNIRLPGDDSCTFCTMHNCYVRIKTDHCNTERVSALQQTINVSEPGIVLDGPKST